MKRITPITAAARAAPPPTPPYAPPGWQVERRIPPALIIAAISQLCALVAWAVYLDARVAHLEADAPIPTQLAERFVRIEERLEGLREDIGELKDAMKR